jgi:hypothetical protein
LEVWTRLEQYTREDFPAGQAFYRMRAFTLYFARNFLFGHTLHAAAQSAPDLETLRERATRFLAAQPQQVETPSVSGLN